MRSSPVCNFNHIEGCVVDQGVWKNKWKDVLQQAGILLRCFFRCVCLSLLSRSLFSPLSLALFRSWLAFSERLSAVPPSFRTASAAHFRGVVFPSLSAFISSVSNMISSLGRCHVSLHRSVPRSLCICLGFSNSSVLSMLSPSLSYLFLANSSSSVAAVVDVKNNSKLEGNEKVSVGATLFVWYAQSHKHGRVSLQCDSMESREVCAGEQ